MEVHFEGRELAGSQRFPLQKPRLLWSGIQQLLSAAVRQQEENPCAVGLSGGTRSREKAGDHGLSGRSCPRSSRSPNWPVLTQRMEAANTELGAR